MSDGFEYEPGTHCIHNVLVCEACSDRWSRERRLMEEEISSLRRAFESANDALATVIAGKPIKDMVGRYDSYTLTVDKLRQAREELAAARKELTEVREALARQDARVTGSL